MSRIGLIVLLAVCGWSAGARADRVFLTSGAVIEGKARAQGDRVVIELESGELRLPADAVAKIEPAPSPVQSYEARRKKLAPGDVAGRMELADYCRDHGMHGHERELLLEVIELGPDHAAARERLGYVRGAHGWIERDEQLRAQGLVEHEGRWLTREQALEIERLHAQAETAAHERDRARAELETKRVELETKKIEAEREAKRGEAPPAAEPTVVYSQVAPLYFAPYWYFDDFAYVHRTPRRHAARPGPRRTPFPIVGVRDPWDYLR